MRFLVTVSLVFLVFLTWAQPTFPLRYVNDMPNSTQESSGLYASHIDSLWTLNDSGGDNILILSDTFNDKARELVIAGAVNVDWEDLMPGNGDGYVYIGDIGNNFQDRTDLKFYRVLDPATVYEPAVFAEIISFSYEDQTEFPPQFGLWIYDCEASVVIGDEIYLFTKDWTVPMIGYTRIYKIPKTIGAHVATFLGSFYTDNSSFSKGGVSGAALSPDGTKLILVSNRKLWLFRNFVGTDFLNGDVTEYDMLGNTQKEAVTFFDDCTIYVCDEASNGIVSRLFIGNVCEVLSDASDIENKQTPAIAYRCGDNLCLQWTEGAASSLRMTELGSGRILTESLINQTSGRHTIVGGLPTSGPWLIEWLAADGSRVAQVRF
jgi:hypothetical protein